MDKELRLIEALERIQAAYTLIANHYTGRWEAVVQTDKARATGSAYTREDALEAAAIGCGINS